MMEETVRESHTKWGIYAITQTSRWLKRKYGYI